MTTENRRQFMTRGLMVLIIAGLLVYAGFSFRSFVGSPSGSSQRDTLRIACLGCGAEMVLPASQSSQLPISEETGGMKCPKCGAFRAYPAQLTCPKCKRGVPLAPELKAGAFVCPWCKASLDQP